MNKDKHVLILDHKRKLLKFWVWFFFFFKIFVNSRSVICQSVFKNHVQKFFMF